MRDDYPAYAKYDKNLAAVQLCYAHLIRALRGIGELDSDPQKVQRCWTEPVRAALLEARAAVAEARRGQRRAGLGPARRAARPL